MSAKIWILNHYATAKGTSTRHFDIAKELAGKGYDVTICASSFEHITRQEKKQYRNGYSLAETLDGVKFIWLKTTAYRNNGLRRVMNMLTYSYRAYTGLKKTGESPDFIIGSLMHPFAALVGCLLAKRYGCKFYFEERDLWPQTLIDLGKVSRSNPVVWLLSKLELYLYRKADRIIVLFEHAVGYVQGKGIDPRKIVHIPNGIDLARHDRHSGKLPAEYELWFRQHEGQYIAAYTGAHGLANNLDAVLDAAKITKEGNEQIHYLLIGDGPEKQRLTERKRREHLTNVTLMPPVPKEQIPAILQQVHVGLLPLKDSPVFKWGISPNKLYDYMASRLPVILLCDTENSDIERSGGGVVIKEQFPVHLAGKLIEFAANPEGTRRMGQAAREYVVSHHSWNILSETLLSAVREDGTALTRGL